MTLAQFVEKFFQLIGARYEPSPDGLRVELTPGQLQQLEGRPRWGWSAPGDELTVLYFSFAGPPPAETEMPSAEVQPEFVGPGSFRLRQITDAAMRLWGLSRVFVRPAGTRVRLWHPHFVFHFTVTYVARTTRQRTLSVSVDLVTGTAVDFSGFPPEAELRQGAGGIPATPARLSVGEAHERAVNYLCRELSREDSEWSSDQRSWIHTELEQLHAYLRRAELEDTKESLAAVRAARLAELRDMLSPHVQVRAATATVLYLPTQDEETT